MIDNEYKNRIVLVTGGARSGKSLFAESLLEDKENVVDIATAQVYDEEMADRVKKHQEQRPSEWMTFEAPQTPSASVGKGDYYLLDCLTVLTSNWMFALTEGLDKIPPQVQKDVEDQVMQEMVLLIEGVRALEGVLAMVTNEVGCSIVPEHHISRVYRDIIGRVNQRVVKLSDEVYIVSCGIPLRLK